MNKTLLTLVLMIFCISGFSQNRQKIDSLTKVLEGEIPDTTRALHMMHIAVQYEPLDTTVSFQKYREAISFAKSKSLDYQLGLIYQNFSFLYSGIGKYAGVKGALDTSMIYLKKSTHPKRDIMIGYVYGSLGDYYRNTNDFLNATESYLKGIDILERHQMYCQVINQYLDLSGIYKGMMEFEKEEEYCRKALEIARKTNLPLDYFKAYSFIALALVMQNKYEEGLKYIDSARSYYVGTAAPAVLVSYHLISGLTYLNFYNLDSARANFQKSAAVAEKYGHLFSKLQSKLQLGRVLTLEKKFTQADSLLHAVNNQLMETGEQSQFQVSLDYIARNYEDWGKYKEALQYYKEFKIVSDSMSSVANKQFIADLEVKYETAKKNSQILEQQTTLRQKNTFNYILIGCAISLLAILALGYRNYLQRQRISRLKITELETEKHLMATEAVLKGEEQERTRLAKDLHDGLGGMLSGIKYSFQAIKGNMVMTPENHQHFERSMDMLDSSIKEMRRVAHNMMPEALVKFGLDTALRDFCNDINESGVLKVNYQSTGLNEPSLDQTTAITVYRIVQELLNNSIKHAGAHAAIVQINQTTEMITLTVEDDGKGFDTSILSAAKGMGWNNIKSRVDFLKGKLDIQSNENNGTSVLIELKV